MDGCFDRMPGKRPSILKSIYIEASFNPMNYLSDLSLVCLFRQTFCKSPILAPNMSAQQRIFLLLSPRKVSAKANGEPLGYFLPVVVCHQKLSQPEFDENFFWCHTNMSPWNSKCTLMLLQIFNESVVGEYWPPSFSLANKASRGPSYDIIKPKSQELQSCVQKAALPDWRCTREGCWQSPTSLEG